MTFRGLFYIALALLITFLPVKKTIAETTGYLYPPTNESLPQLIYSSQLMSFIQQTYQNQIKNTQPHATLNWQFDWSQPYLGAGSTLYNNMFSIMLWGGFVRAPQSNFEVIALTLCHEVGHYLGGSPKQKINSPTGDWASSEGQADWFATQSCLPLVFDYFKKNNLQSLNFIYPTLTKKICLQLDPYLDVQQLEKCQWLVGSSAQFGKFIQLHFAKDIAVPSLEQSAPEKPQETLYSTYPSLQCRVDTLKQGSLCAASSLIQKKSACIRPSCWFVQE
jgi:hypothetical protein